MDNTVFERNYETPQEDMEYCTAVFEQAVEGGFFQRYCDMVDKVPKIINPQDKENYEYLVNRCDQYAKRHYGRISAVVDYERWDSKINLYLPMLEFTTEEDMLLLRDIGEKAHYVNITQQPDGKFRLHIMINYFEPMMSDIEAELIKYKALEQDEKLASMFQMPELSLEDNEVIQRMKVILDRFDEETAVDRMTAFKAVLDHIGKMDAESKTLEHMAEKSSIRMQTIALLFPQLCCSWEKNTRSFLKESHSNMAQAMSEQCAFPARATAIVLHLVPICPMTMNGWLKPTPTLNEWVCWRIG